MGAGAARLVRCGLGGGSGIAHWTQAMIPEQLPEISQPFFPVSRQAYPATFRPSKLGLNDPQRGTTLAA